VKCSNARLSKKHRSYAGSRKCIDSPVAVLISREMAEPFLEISRTKYLCGVYASSVGAERPILKNNQMEVPDCFGLGRLPNTARVTTRSVDESIAGWMHMPKGSRVVPHKRVYYIAGRCAIAIGEKVQVKRA